MFCANCGKAVSEGAAFCGECGAKIETVQAQTAPMAQPVQAYQAVAATTKPKGLKKLAVIIPVAAVAVVLAVVAIVVLPKVLNKDGSGTTPTEQGSQAVAGENNASEEIKTYSEDEVKEYFNWLTGTYNGVSSQIFVLDEKNFDTLALEWFMPSEETYQFYRSNVRYDDTISCLRDKTKKIAISEIMSEDEFEALANSGREVFDVFKVSDIQANIDNIWVSGRFSAEALDNGSFSSSYITSKGYLFLPIDPTGYYSYNKAKYVSYEQSGNEYVVKCYMICADADSGDCMVYDESTDLFLGTYSDGYMTDPSSKSFGQVLNSVGKTTSDLQTIEFVLEGTAEGLRLKKVNYHKVLPDVRGNFGTKYVSAGGEGLNIRTAPSKTAMVVGLALDAEPVYVCGKSESTNEWVYIYFFGEDNVSYSGWVNKNYLK